MSRRYGAASRFRRPLQQQRRRQWRQPGEQRPPSGRVVGCQPSGRARGGVQMNARVPKGTTNWPGQVSDEHGRRRTSQRRRRTTRRVRGRTGLFAPIVNDHVPLSHTPESSAQAAAAES
uniref:Uncharacterized protein n=1 Tax=Plectus sambesii TaxID=2011161 RepID=A0A914VBM8_9BILA